MKNVKISKNSMMNLGLRFQNKVWVAALLTQIVNFVIFLVRAFGGDVSGDVENNVGSIIQIAALVISSAIGRFMDPTTQGIGDSQRNLVKTNITGNGHESMREMDDQGQTLPPSEQIISNGNRSNEVNIPEDIEYDEENPEGNATIDSNYNPSELGGGGGSVGQ